MARSISFGKTTKGDEEIALTFRRDNWGDIAKTIYMKHHLILGDATSEKVSCKYCILSGMEEQSA